MLAGPAGRPSQLSVELPITNGLGQVLGADLVAGVEVGDGPSHLADLVMGAGAEAELHHGLLQHQLAGGIELAELLKLLVAHIVREAPFHDS